MENSLFNPLYIKLPGYYKPIDPKFIVWFQGSGNYTFVYFADGNHMLSCCTLLFFEQQLPDFIRVHKSALINPLFITSLKGFRFFNPSIELKNGVVITISRRRFSKVKETLYSTNPNLFFKRCLGNDN
ncbi:LytR/AlgR family response regulator transcription factor [Spirosoma gilvum]